MKKIPTMDITELNEKIKKETEFIDILRMELGKSIVGQKNMIDKMLIALFANGHLLVEGVPGLAKTLAIKSLASAIDAKFNRIQFTPDLLPADITGTMIYSPKKEEFEVKFGPVFANFILADEINRSPAKVQSALLEAMQERQVTLGEQTYKLPDPFLVMATQNSIEQEGTYPLPEAQVDRFMMKVIITYPSKDEEKIIIQRNLEKKYPMPSKVAKIEDILRMRDLIHEIYMDEKIQDYITDIVFATRYPDKYGLSKYKSMIAYGASPRAGISMALAAKAYALLQRRGYVLPEDVRAIAPEVLRHRIGLTYEAEAENITTDIIIVDIINAVRVP
ncbi:MAG: AAA family ATPase [Bacteroidales bacterium]|nr:AAA family ATPase [Bacteroidales bacterium]